MSIFEIPTRARPRPGTPTAHVYPVIIGVHEFHFIRRDGSNGIYNPGLGDVLIVEKPGSWQFPTEKKLVGEERES